MTRAHAIERGIIRPSTAPSDPTDPTWNDQPTLRLDALARMRIQRERVTPLPDWQADRELWGAKQEAWILFGRGQT